MHDSILELVGSRYVTKTHTNFTANLLVAPLPL